MFVWESIIFGLALVGLNYGPPLVWRALQMHQFGRLTKKRLVLTYDDGPDTFVTPELLDLLHAHDAKASFYVVGFRAERAPEVLARMVEEGHEIGCHSFLHRNQWKQWPWTSVADLRRAYREMDGWLTGRGDYRPVFGKLTTGSLLWLLWTRRRPIWWTAVGRDATGALPSAEETARDLLADGGGVILLHSFHKERDRKEYVLTITARLLELAAEKDYSVLTVGELMNGGGPGEDGRE